MEMCVERLGPADCLSPERRLDLSIQLQALRHPTLARQLGLTVEDGELLLVRESVPGMSLERMLESAVGSLAPAEILPWLIQVADLGQRLHDRGSPWRLAPLEPAQLVVTPEGRLVLIDLRPLQQPGTDALREDLRAVGRFAGRLLNRPLAELPAGWRNLLGRLRSERAPLKSFAELKAALTELQPPSAAPVREEPKRRPRMLLSGIVLAALVTLGVLVVAAASQPAVPLLRGPLLAVAQGQRLQLRPLSLAASPRELSLGAPVAALTADPGGNLWVALADGVLLQLDSRRLEPRQVDRLPHRTRRLEFGFPTRAVAADLETGWVGFLELRESGWATTWHRRRGITDLACGPDGVYAARGQLETWPWQGEPRPQGGDAYRLALSPDGAELAIATRSGRIEVRGKGLLGEAGPAPRALAWAGSRLWVATGPPRLLRFPTAGGEPLAVPLTSPARAMVVGGGALWVALQDGVSRVDLGTGAVEPVLAGRAEALCVRE